MLMDDMVGDEVNTEDEKGTEADGEDVSDEEEVNALPYDCE